METGVERYRPLRAGLCIYECVRLVFLVGAFLTLRPDALAVDFPWLPCLAANALFPLMALLALADGSRYAGYWPLYSAGKCVSCVSAALWCVLFGQIILNTAFAGYGTLVLAAGVPGILVAGDALSAAAGLVLARKTRPPAPQPVEVSAGGE